MVESQTSKIEGQGIKDAVESRIVSELREHQLDAASNTRVGLTLATLTALSVAAAIWNKAPVIRVLSWLGTGVCGIGAFASFQKSRQHNRMANLNKIMMTVTDATSTLDFSEFGESLDFNSDNLDNIQTWAHKLAKNKEHHKLGRS